MKKIIKHGVPLYTSDELNDKLKEFISKSRVSEKIKELLYKFIEQGILTAVINEQSKLKRLIMKLKRIRPMIYQYGFADDYGTYILFNPGTSPREIVDTALHELIHFTFRQSPKKFTSINMKLCSQFYTILYTELFKTKKYDQKKFSLFLFDFFMKDTYNNNLLIEAFKDYSPLSEKEIDNLMNMIFKVWDYNEKNEAYKVPENNIVKLALEKAYMTLFKGMDQESIVGQELYKEHEIIAILSTINPNHPNVIKTLEITKPEKIKEKVVKMNIKK